MRNQICFSGFNIISFQIFLDNHNLQLDEKIWQAGYLYQHRVPQNIS